MRKRTILVIGVVVAANAALWLAQIGGAFPVGLGSLGSYFFGQRLVRAEVVVKTAGVVHDYRVDRGRIRAVTATSLTLLERDGSIVTVPIAAGADVKLAGSPTTLTSLRRGMRATTIRDDNAAAATVYATRR